MISLKIDVSKIDKKRLYKGAKGTYLTCVLIETPNSDYGDYMVVEEVSKDERAQGVKGTILGNAKIIKPRTESTPQPEQPNQPEPNSIVDLPNGIDEDPKDLPF